MNKVLGALGKVDLATIRVYSPALSESLQHHFVLTEAFAVSDESLKQLSTEKHYGKKLERMEKRLRKELENFSSLSVQLLISATSETDALAQLTSTLSESTDKLDGARVLLRRPNEDVQVMSGTHIPVRVHSHATHHSVFHLSFGERG